MPAIPRVGIVSMFNNPVYDLLQNDDLPELAQSVGLPRALYADYRNGFAYIHDGEIVALWGFVGLVPYNSKLVTRLYYEPIDSQIVSMYWSIGEVYKTKRYPKTLETFWTRARQWIDARQSMPPGSVNKHTVIAAYNARYITKKSAIELYGIERESLWLER